MWPTDWQINQVTNSLITEWATALYVPTNWLIDKLSNWPSDWLSQDKLWATDLLTDKLTKWLSDVQTDQLTDWETQIYLLTNQLT